jgi:hypothetical protein
MLVASAGCVFGVLLGGALAVSGMADRDAEEDARYRQFVDDLTRQKMMSVVTTEDEGDDRPLFVRMLEAEGALGPSMSLKVGGRYWRTELVDGEWQWVERTGWMR